MPRRGNFFSFHGSSLPKSALFCCQKTHPGIARILSPELRPAYLLTCRATNFVITNSGQFKFWAKFFSLFLPFLGSDQTQEFRTLHIRSIAVKKWVRHYVPFWTSISITPEPPKNFTITPPLFREQNEKEAILGDFRRFSSPVLSKLMSKMGPEIVQKWV